MTIEICTVGGFSEVGKNMTAIKVGDDVVIIDMGIYLPAVLDIQDDVVWQELSSFQLSDMGAIPDDSVIKDWKDKVKAIVLGHCHLDHIGAIPYMAAKYRAPIIGTPYTIEVLKSLLKDEKVKLPNQLKPVKPNSKIKINKNLTIELINITHSTLQCAMIAVHTPGGVVLYANDFKFDNSPVVGEKPNYKRLRELGKKGVKVLLVESLYADRQMKTPSEKVARELLKEVLLSVDNRGKAVFVTTFASHIARIKSAIEFGKKLNRKVLLFGRSMGRYVKAAEDLGLVNFSKSAEIYAYKSQIQRKLGDVAKNRGKYLVICTGNQAEPNAVLTRLANKEFKFKFQEGDQVVFSCKTIPQASNIANRHLLESQLKKQKVRTFIDIHQSGHASREDLRDFFDMVKPDHIIPAHGEVRMETALADLASEKGYVIGETVHLMTDGRKLVLE